MNKHDPQELGHLSLEDRQISNKENPRSTVGGESPEVWNARRPLEPERPDRAVTRTVRARESSDVHEPVSHPEPVGQPKFRSRADEVGQRGAGRGAVVDRNRVSNSSEMSQTDDAGNDLPAVEWEDLLQSDEIALDKGKTEPFVKTDAQPFSVLDITSPSQQRSGEFQETINRLANENRRLSNQLASAESKLKELSVHLERTRGDRDRQSQLELELKDLGSKHTQVLEVKDRLTSENAQLHQQLRSAEERSKKLNVEESSKTHRVEELTNHLAEQQEARKKIEMALKSVEQHREELTNQLAEEREARQEIELAIESAEQHREELSRSLEHSREVAKNRESELSDLLAAEIALKEKATLFTTKCKKKMNELYAFAKTQRQKYENAKRQLAESNAALEKSESDNRQLVMERNALGEQVHELLNASDVSQLKTELERGCQDFQAFATESNEQVASAEIALSTAAMELEGLRTKIIEISDSMRNLSAIANGDCDSK